MKILAVDDEMLMLDALVSSIRAAAPDAELYSFRRPLEALAFAEENEPDVAFLDINMRGMDGLELAKRLLDMFPAINIIFCTSYNEYISEAFQKIRCNGFITKPVDAEQIATELKHLRVPLGVLTAKSASVTPAPAEQVSEAEENGFGDSRRVRFQCMGRFEMFIDDMPVAFTSAKTKELVAFLVHACGGVCGNQETIAALWDDDNRHDSYYKKIRKDLMVTLAHNGCSRIILQQRGGLAIDMRAVECDFYRWRETHPGQMPEEYMTQYPWANIPQYEW